MNKKERKTQEELTRKMYTIPSGANYQLRSKNAVYISPSNTLKHELAKTIGAYSLRKYGDIKIDIALAYLLKNVDLYFNLLMKEFTKEKCDFITEACPKKEPDRRVDLVRLWDNQRFEFETNPKVKKENCITFYLE